MSNDKIYDDVLAYITEHGETGVNVLARHCDIPLSTMQRYLEKQSYFKKTVSRKWDIPDNVNADIKSNTMTLMVDSVENALKLVDAQLAEIRLSVQNALMPVNTLKRAVDVMIAPVAAKTVEMHPKLELLDKDVKELQHVFKQHVGKCPKDYQDMLNNLDFYSLFISMGGIYILGTFNFAIGDLFLEKTTELPDDIIDVIMSYQKEA